METKNLVIRYTTFDDCKYFADWESRWEVNEFFAISDDRDYEEIVREFVVREMDLEKQQFTIVLKETEAPIGRIYISKVDTHMDSCDITRIYIAQPALRGRGYGEEALRAVLDYCFMNLHMERVTLDYFPGNKAGAALYEKLGLKHDGIARNAGKKNGKYYDLHLMSILRADYYEKIHAK